MNHHQNINCQTTVQMIEKSKIVKKITSETDLNTLGKIYKILALSEIPFAAELAYTKKLINEINTEISTVEGFSYTGKVEDIVPCYNAMLLGAYCRLGLGHTQEAQKALNWIKKYQVFQRNQLTRWSHKGICKHGGCLNAVTCYIGIGKSIKGLLIYRDLVSQNDCDVNQLIDQGIDYMLKHQMYLRLSENVPISPHITDSIFPETYPLSLTDLVEIVGRAQLKNRIEVQPLLNLIESKKTVDGGWKVDYRYHYQGYMPFETRRKDSEWLAYFYNNWLG
ncbi:hypothetical protein ESZ54_10815 [Vagococcus silagei]|uniref:Alginate lyase domain-containing protein n=2 Tax=Vagococcus silagei TaxID=2508885 RepID=A0A4S3B2B6_9ENTE|nr:hypothetical protein ESZ54_10815 [Vagococcus silagei]